MFKVILRSFGAFPIFPTFSNIASQKRLVVEQNADIFWPLWYLFNAYGVLLTVKLFNVMLRSIGIFSILNNLVSRKRLGVGRNGPQFWPWGKVSVHRILLTFISV